MQCATCMVSTFLLATAFVGCGSDGNGPAEPLDVQFGQSVKALVSDLQRTLQQEGLPGLRSQIEGAAENLAGYASEVPSEHQATFDQIVSGVNELKTLVNGSPTREEITGKLSSLVEVAQKLPGGDPAQPAGG